MVATGSTSAPSQIPDHAGWCVSTTFKVIPNATLRDVHLTRLVVEHERGDQEPTLTARTLRDVKPELLRRNVRLELLRAEWRVDRDLAAEIGIDHATLWQLHGAFRATPLNRRGRPRTGRPQTWSNLELARVAQRYEAVCKEQPKRPIVALAEEIGYSAATVRMLRGLADQPRPLQRSWTRQARRNAHPEGKRHPEEGRRVMAHVEKRGPGRWRARYRAPDRTRTIADLRAEGRTRSGGS